MAAPQITVVFNPPLPTDTGVEFDAKAFETVSDWNDWSVEANALAVFQNEKADETLMSAIAGNLSEVDLSVAAGDLIGVNVGGTALESVEIEEVPKGTQAEAEAGLIDTAYMTPLKVSQLRNANRFEFFGSAVSLTGSSVEITGVPSGVRKVDLIFSEVSLSNGDDIIVQLGGASSYVTSGYTAQSSVINIGMNVTSGFPIIVGDATREVNGVKSITRTGASSNTWVGGHVCGLSVVGAGAVGGGIGVLTEELTRIRIKSESTGVFDSGSVVPVYYL